MEDVIYVLVLRACFTISLCLEWNWFCLGWGLNALRGW